MVNGERPPLGGLSFLYSIIGVNEMYVYDAAQRMGAFLGLKPQKVYLHAGVRRGPRVAASFA